MPDHDKAPDRHAVTDGQDSNWSLLIGSYVAILLALAAIGFLVVRA